MTKKITLFDCLNFCFIFLLTLCCLYPLLYIFVISISTPEGYYSSVYHILPNSVTFDNYKAIIDEKTIFNAFSMSIKVTVLGTVLSIILTTIAGYVFSKKDLPYMNTMFKLALLTMYFSGGMVPMYLLVSSFQLKDTIWALILPGMIATFNVVLARNYFLSMPSDLEAAARIDGASEFKIFVSIIIPLSKPIVATLVLFYAVQYWNNYVRAILYLSDSRLFTLPLIIRNLLVQTTNDAAAQAAGSLQFKEGINMAAVMISIIPILVIYPWIQKYFVKGIMIGAVKG